MDWRLEPLILPFLIATLLLLALPKPGHPESFAPAAPTPSQPNSSPTRGEDHV
jgi:hypothetical protein